MNDRNGIACKVVRALTWLDEVPGRVIDISVLELSISWEPLNISEEL